MRGVSEEHIPMRYVTNEQRRRRTPFQANPLGRGQLADVTASPARTALKIGQLTDGGVPPTYDSMH